MLVRLLSEEQTQEARREISEQLSYLKRADTTDPEVLRLEMMQLDPKRDADQIKRLYATLPETTALDMDGKARIALQEMGDKDEAIRLYKMAVAADPTAPQFVAMLAQLYAVEGKRADAVATMVSGLQAMPGNSDLQALLKRMEDTPGSAAQTMQQQVEGQITDPVARNVKLSSDALQAGNTADCLKYLDAAAKIKADDPDVLDGYFKLYVVTRQWDKLKPYVDKLSQLDKDQAHGLLYQFEWARAQGDADRQFKIAAQLEAAMPEFAKSYYCLAQAYQAKGNYEQAIQNYDTALRKKGEGLEAAMMLKSEIDCYYRMNRPDQAAVAIGEGRRRFPDDDDFRELEIKYEDAHGDVDGAERNLEDLHRLHPEAPGVFLDLASARMQVAAEKLRMGDSAAAEESTHAAADLMKEAVKQFPDNYQMYQLLANIDRACNDPKTAEAVLLSMQKRPIWQKDASSRYLLGQFYSEINEQPKAEAAYAEALKLAKPDEMPVIQVRYAAALYADNKIDQALAVLSAANADNAIVRRQKVNILVQIGKIDEAEAQLKLIPAANAGEKSELELEWAQLELVAGRRNESDKHLAASLAANPNNALALVMRARLKMSQSPPDLDGALADLNSAHESNPSNVQVLLTIADVDVDRLDLDQARQAMSTALQIDPTNFGVRTRLAYMYANYQPVQVQRALSVLQDGLNQPGGQTNADLFTDIANCYQQMGHMDQALQTISAAMQRMPSSYLLVNAYLRMNLEARQYQKVIDAASEVITRHPEIWWAWQFRGQAQARLGDKSAGMSDLLQALSSPEAQKDTSTAVSIVEAISRDVDTQKAIDVAKQRLGTADQWKYILILLYHRSGQDADAVKLLEPLLAQVDTLPMAQRLPRLQLAGTVFATAQPKPYSDEAYSTYKKLISLSPNDVQALNNFACVCADDYHPPKLVEGLAAIRHAIDLSSGAGTSDPLVEDTYGWLLILGGQTPEGVDMVRKAVARLPMVEGYYHLGEGYLRLNQPDEAQRQVNLALDAIAKAKDSDQPVSDTTRGHVQDLANRVLASLRLRTSQNGAP
jgi:tetratricopeptide (TPR) repeat protein